MLDNEYLCCREIHLLSGTSILYNRIGKGEEEERKNRQLFDSGRSYITMKEYYNINYSPSSFSILYLGFFVRFVFFNSLLKFSILFLFFRCQFLFNCLLYKKGEKQKEDIKKGWNYYAIDYRYSLSLGIEVYLVRRYHQYHRTGRYFGNRVFVACVVADLILGGLNIGSIEDKYFRED